MFRVELFCDDRKLPDVLRALTGLLIGEPKIQPVVNGKKENGVLVASNRGTLNEMFVKYAKTHSLTKFAPVELKEFCRYTGYAESSYNYVLDVLKANKLVRKHGSGRNVRYSAVAS